MQVGAVDFGKRQVEASNLLERVEKLAVYEDCGVASW